MKVSVMGCGWYFGNMLNTETIGKIMPSKEVVAITKEGIDS